MKKIILAILVFALGATVVNAKWIKPPRKNCTSNGGKLASGGVCEANWSDAKAICRSMRAKLPTIKQLRRVVTRCGGVVDDYENNQNDPAYQSCYKSKGFSDKEYYWSSTTYEKDSSSAWIINFKNGNDNSNNKSNDNYVLCVRG